MSSVCPLWHKALHQTFVSEKYIVYVTPPVSVGKASMILKKHLEKTEEKKQQISVYSLLHRDPKTDQTRHIKTDVWEDVSNTLIFTHMCLSLMFYSKTKIVVTTVLNVLTLKDNPPITISLTNLNRCPYLLVSILMGL